MNAAAFHPRLWFWSCGDDGIHWDRDANARPAHAEHEACADVPTDIDLHNADAVEPFVPGARAWSTIAEVRADEGF